MSLARSELTSELAPDVDAKLARVSSRADHWHALSAAEKLVILRAVHQRADAACDRWAAVANSLRGLDTPDKAELTGLGYVFTTMLLGPSLVGYRATYERLARGETPAALETRMLPSGRLSVHAFPSNLREKVLFGGFRGELWLEPGQPLSVGSVLRKSEPAVCLVLGGGNFEGPREILDKLFGEAHVVLYKPNPTNEAVVPILEEIFAPLVEAGFVAFLPSDVGTAGRVMNDPRVDEVFLTGSAASFDHIVWGEATEQSERKRLGAKVMRKPIHAELGGVCPVLVVPGTWSERDITHHARQIAAAKALNAGHVCASPQVVMTSRQWPQRRAFLDRLKQELRVQPVQPCYYPQSRDRMRQWAEAVPKAQRLGGESAGEWAFVFHEDLPHDSPLLREEAFCPVLTEVALDEGPDPAAFLEAATSFANTRLWGSLSATVLVHPREMRALGVALDACLERLEYGSIGVNVFGAMANTGALRWGAYPKHSAQDVGSGIGALPSCRMVDHVEKTVLWSPFRSPAHLQPASIARARQSAAAARFLLRPTAGRFAALIRSLIA